MVFVNDENTVSASSPSKNSIPLGSQIYERDDYFGRLKPRTNRDCHLADAGSWRCQADFLGSSAAARADLIRNQAHMMDGTRTTTRQDLQRNNEAECFHYNETHRVLIFRKHGYAVAS
jgi:hypothetical protein